MSDALWNDLETLCRSCRNCPLGKTRTNLVFGTGNRNADLLFVGEAPGQAEDEQGLPCVGAAGKLLRNFFQLRRVIQVAEDKIFIPDSVGLVPAQADHAEGAF